MEINPTVSERTNDQLLEILETHEQWRPEVVELAKQELTSRGISLKTAETRRTIRAKFNERIRKVKERATYTGTEKMLIVLLGPVLILFLQDFLMFHSGEGYKKKNRQGAFYLILGFCLWVLMVYVYFEITEEI